MNEGAVDSPRAWTFLTIEGTRQYGGNAGYDDDPAKLYRYDSDVANHRQVRAGDVAVIRSLATVVGVATVESVTEGEGLKERLRCPECSTVNIKARSTAEPPYRCHKGHVFVSPVRESVTVRTYEARYAGTFRTIGSDVTVARLLDAVMRPSDQMSIKEIDLGQLDTVLRQEPGLARLLDRFARQLSPPDYEGDGERAGSIIEERRRVLREIALRRGQRRFRKRLIERYGLECQISGCALPGLVEAAHVTPYAGSSDNSASNGLLLRSDLHTLFDLGLLAIDPRSLLVRFRSDVVADGYHMFEGKALRTNGTRGPDRTALADRWNFFAPGPIAPGP